MKKMKREEEHLCRACNLGVLAGNCTCSWETVEVHICTMCEQQERVKQEEARAGADQASKLGKERREQEEKDHRAKYGCQAILKSGKRRGQKCGRLPRDSYSGYPPCKHMQFA